MSSVHLDPESNAASIVFDPKSQVGHTIELEYGGSVVGTVTFSRSGRIIELECLDAQHQLPEGIMWNGEAAGPNDR
ncbi:DUF2283 domain-containing protein [Acidipropionibacterium jensenii]|uniref:DUF2283 domain-containing protein n=1 Tax=Acidipropionibacterium jensenii TaxID=1749 RepID=A0A3Q9UHY1_9ACTN|nr:DUF2283 domain-containing protein [Acidipropionibacterium jensenii]